MSGNNLSRLLRDGFAAIIHAWSGRRWLAVAAVFLSVISPGTFSGQGLSDLPGREGIREEVLAKIVTFALPSDFNRNDAPPVERKKFVAPESREYDPNGLNEISFDDIAFDTRWGDPYNRSQLTENIRRLDGLKVRIRGFIKPAARQDNITRFILVRDNQECCFGPSAALCDCILVSLANRQTTKYTVRPISVTGTFYVEEYVMDDIVWAVFRMKDARVD